MKKNGFPLFLVVVIFLFFMVSTTYTNAATSLIKGERTVERNTKLYEEDTVNNAIEFGSKSLVNYVFRAGEMASRNNETIIVLDSTSSKSVFDYTIFGKTTSEFNPAFSAVKLNGDYMDVKGTVHSNSKFSVTGNSSHPITIQGSIESVGDAFVGYHMMIDGPIRSNSNITVANIADPVAPTYNSKMDAQKVDNVPTILNLPDVMSYVKSMVKPSNSYSGDQYFSKIDIAFDNPMYVDGNLGLNSFNINGAGFIAASKDIVLHAEQIGLDSGNSVDAGGVAIIADRNIEVHGRNITINGILYAPNGKVSIDCDGFRINGKIIANEVEINSGSTSTTYIKDASYPLIEAGFRTAEKAIIKDFIKTYANLSDQNNKDNKVGIVEYNKKATLVSPLLSLTSGNVTTINQAIDQIQNQAETFADGSSNEVKRNIGDALRYAYHVLSESGTSGAEKNVILIADGWSNMFTKDSAVPTDFMIGPGIASDATLSGFDLDKAKAYSDELAGLIKTSGIKTSIITTKGILSYKDVAKAKDQINYIAQEAGAEQVSSGKYFYDTNDEKELENALSQILAKWGSLPDELTLTNVRITQKLPKGVNVMEVPEGFMITKLLGEGMTISGTIPNINIKKSGDGYVMTNTSDLKINGLFAPKEGEVIHLYDNVSRIQMVMPETVLLFDVPSMSLTDQSLTLPEEIIPVKYVIDIT
jgi:hypothetical protein